MKFHLSGQKSETLHCDGLLFSKSYKVKKKKKVQKTYLPWYWGLIQSLKKNWLVVLNVTGIWWIFTQPLKSPKMSIRLTLMFDKMSVKLGFELRKYRRVIFHDTEQGCKIRINPDLLISKMAWGIVWTFIRAHNWQVSEELCVMTLKGAAKFKQKPTCGLKNDIKNLVNFYARSWKSKNLHFDWII